LKEICRQIPVAKSNAKLDENNFLPSFLTTCIRESSNASLLREKILTLCFYSAISCSNLPNEKPSNLKKHRWLSLTNTVGGCLAAAIVLDAAELAGEETFPLILRWTLVGSRIFDTFFSSGNELDASDVRLSHLTELAKCSAVMLKGIIVTDPVVIVSTGPVSSRQGNGGRARSYSLGKMDGISLLTPYPDEMTTAMVRVLSQAETNHGARIISTKLVQTVLASAAWASSKPFLNLFERMLLGR
jgi:hypothetical protein